uniref:Tachykinin precursor 3a n=1 Tax=Oryzias latipes TaxID=8090 RepID=A0A3P9IPV7_ORYLA
MRSGLLLVTLFIFVKLRYSQSRCEETASRRSTLGQPISLEEFKRNLLRRYTDLDYDSFVGLMGKRNAEEEAVQSQPKRDMDDIFVGLMGRRSSETENGPWRRDYPDRRGVLFNKSRLRFLQGL